MSTRLNTLLVVGAAAMVCFVAVSAIGPRLSRYSIDDAEKFFYAGADATTEGELFMAPHPPSRRHIFGTDKWGYDLYTLMLAGAKYTVFGTLIMAALRVVAGSTVGIALALFRGGAGHRLPSEPHSGPYGSIPVFILLYFILNRINFNPPFSPFCMASIQGTLIVILGVPKIAVVASRQATTLLGRAHITAARSIGAGNARIAVRHVLPLMREQLIILFSHETMGVLTLLGALALFNIFLGGTRMTDRPTLYHSITHEWAGLVGQHHALIQGPNWMLFFPLLFYFLFLCTLFLVSLGVKRSLGEGGSGTEM